MDEYVRGYLAGYRDALSHNLAWRTILRGKLEDLLGKLEEYERTQESKGS